MSRTLARVLMGMGAILLLLGFLWLRSCQEARTAGTVAKVAKGQAGAAIQSGADAANTIGNRMAADAATDQLTRENEDAIRNAEGAAAPVAAPARDAGLASLCRRAAYRGKPECVQHAAPR